MTNKQTLERNIKLATNAINNGSAGPASYFSRAKACIELGKLDKTSGYNSQILADLEEAIKLNSENPKYHSTLMEFYCTTGNAEKAIAVGLILRGLLKDKDDEGIEDMSSKQTLAKVLEMKEILELVKDPEIHKAFEGLMNFLSPYITKIEEHESKLEQHEAKFLEQESRIEHEEEEIQKQKTDVQSLKQAVDKLASEYESHASSEEMIIKLEKELAKHKELILNVLDAEELKLIMKVTAEEKRLNEISKNLISYAKGYYKVLDNAIQASKVIDSKLLNLHPSEGKVEGIFSKLWSPGVAAVGMIPIAGAAIAAGAEGINVAKDIGLQHKFEARVNNFAGTIRDLNSIYWNKEIYETILKEILTSSPKVLERIELSKKLGTGFYKIYNKSTEEYKAYKEACKQAYESNTQDIFTTAGAQDAYKLLNDLLNNQDKKIKILNKIHDSFYSMPEVSDMTESMNSLDKKSGGHSKHKVKNTSKVSPTAGASEPHTSSKFYKLHISSAKEKSKLSQDAKDTHSKFVDTQHYTTLDGHENIHHDDQATDLTGHTMQYFQEM